MNLCDLVSNKIKKLSSFVRVRYPISKSKLEVDIDSSQLSQLLLLHSNKLVSPKQENLSLGSWA